MSQVMHDDEIDRDVLDLAGRDTVVTFSTRSFLKQLVSQAGRGGSTTDSHRHALRMTSISNTRGTSPLTRLPVLCGG